MNKNIRLLNYFIYILLLFYLLIDTFTGILLHSGAGSLSVPYKIFVLFLMIIVIIISNPNKVLYFSFLGCLISFSLFSMFCQDYTNTTFAIQNFIKSISVYIFYIYFSVLVRSEPNATYYMEKILKVNAVVFTINMIAGMLGFGYSTYSYGVGIKGFFFAGNEIFLILLSISSIYIHKYTKRKMLFISFVSLLFAILIGTKTAMLALFIIILFNLYDKQTKHKKIIILLCLPVLVLFSYLIFILFLSKLDVFEHIAYNIEKNKDLTGSLLNALMSGRITFLNNSMTLWRENHTPMSFLFGGNYFYNDKGIEIDFFDTLIINGVILTLLCLGLYLNLIIKALKKRQLVLLVLDLLVLVISFIAGHVWTNLTGGVFFAMVNIYFNIVDRKIDYKKGTL